MEPAPGFRNVRVWLWTLELSGQFTHSSALPGAADTGVIFREVDSRVDDLAVALGLPFGGVSERLTWSRCYAGWVGDHIATCGWVSEADTWIGEVMSSIRPGAAEAYIWDCRTTEGFRGRGFYRRLLARILDELAARGMRRAWIATRGPSGAGYRGVARLGYRRVLSIRYLQLGPLRWWHLRPANGSTPDDVAAARRALRPGRRPERGTATRQPAVPSEVAPSQ